MADISLRDYLGKLDTLLNRNAPGEVVHHCRHILQYFPKNAETYRYLGRALVQSSSWEEAGEVFQRVLSVYPDDYTAHLGLSDVYLHLKRPEDAIWHLERAFEQRPNDQAIIEGLRDLYRKHRRVEQAKIQLTAGAVARQYLRNGLFEQAVETLQQALERSPERADLRLLLAQTYSEAGYRVEAAEVALEVLKVLPDCLEANRILTELWLAESRPSDAQRYLNRIQSVEPYLALELAQGGAVPDEAFRLEELDYRKAAEREINTQSPDWLRDIDSNTQPASASSPAASDDPAWLGSFAPDKAVDEDDLPVFDDAFSCDLPNDWLSEAAPAEPAPPRKKTGVTGLLNQLKVPEPAPEPESEAEAPDFESLFPTETTAEELFPADEAELPQTEEPLPDLPDLFADEPAEAAPVVPVRQTGALKETDPLAWLHESGIEIVENADQPISDDLFDADEDNLALQDVDAADPMAWLQGYGGDMINEDAPAARGSMISEEEEALPAASAVDNDDPLAWLQGSGVEIGEEAPAQPTYATQTEEADPLDWLADESMLDEALDLEALIDAPGTSTAPTSPMTASAENNWQSEVPEVQDEELDWLNASEPTSEAPEFVNDNSVRMDSTTEGEPLPDWFAGMAENEPSASTGEVPDWLSETLPVDAETAEPEAEAAGSGMLNWLSSDDLDEETVTDLPPSAVSEEADQSAWMPETSSEDESLSDTGVEAMPDWFAEAAPDQEYEPETPVASGVDETSFGMMSEANEDESASETGVEAMPNWLSETPAAEAPDFELASTDEEAADEGFAWMSAADAEPEAAAEPAETVPDWLSELPSEEESETATTVQMTVQSTPDNLTLIEGIGPKTAAALEASGITTFQQIANTSPDDLYEIVVVEQGVALVGDPETWPKQAQFLVDGDINGFHAYKDYLVGGREPVEDISAPESEVMSAPASDDSGFEWMSEMPNTDETPETTPANDDSGFEWMSDVSGSEDAQAEPAADAPDWLSQMAPVSEESPASSDSVDESGIQWMSDESTDEVAGVPDWLSQMNPADDEEPEAEPTPAAEDSGFEWISEVNTDEEPEAEPASDTPDWLSQMNPADDEEPEAEPTPAAEDSGFEWISEAGTDDQPEAEMASDTPDWLSQMAPADDEEPEAEPAPAAEDSGFDWISQAGADDEPEAEPAADTPDWLSQMAPADDEEPEAEPVADTPDWLSQMVPADDDEPEAEPVTDTPDWLSQMAPADDEEAESETAPAAEASSFQWMTELNAEDEEAEAEPAADTPDWLSQMAPADDEEAEAEPAVDTPDWLSQVKPVTAQTTTLDEPDADFPWEDSMDADQEAEPESSEAAPEWLSNIQSSQSAQPDDEPVEEPVGGGFSWISDMQDQPDETAAEATPVSDRSFGPDDFGDAVEDEMAAAPEPASNAPDWLNAMVPGLDVDYDAPEDEPIEESYVEDPAASAENIAPIQNKREFDWLMNIVEEETQQVRAIQDSGTQRRFVFSRQPAWLRKPTESNEKPSSTPTATQDDDFDVDDVDLPPWLQ